MFWDTVPRCKYILIKVRNLRQHYSRKLIACLTLHVRHHTTVSLPARSSAWMESFAQMLRTYVNKWGRDWCQNIPYALLAYRSTVQSTTGFTPNFLHTGRELRTPMSLMYGNAQVHSQIDRFEVTEKTQEAVQLARQTINEQQLRQKSSTDRKVWLKKMDIGDYVSSLYTLRLSPGVTRKFCSYKTGPYKVVQLLNTEWFAHCEGSMVVVVISV